MVKYKTSMTERQLKEFLSYVAYDVSSSRVTEFIEVVGQAVFSGKEIVFKEEDEMKATVTVDEINAKLTTAAMLDAAEIEESPFPIPFGELPEEPEWDKDWQPGPPPPLEEEEKSRGEF